MPTTPKYADQRTVFDDLGQGVLNNAFKGIYCKIYYILRILGCNDSIELFTSLLLQILKLSFQF